MQIVINIILLCWLCDLSMKYEKVLQLLREIDLMIKNINDNLGGNNG